MPFLLIFGFFFFFMNQMQGGGNRVMSFGKAKARQVTKDTPPTFLWHTVEDTGVPLENSVMFAEALRKAAVPFDLHIYERGKHGIGLGSQPYGGGEKHPWTRDCLFWLKQHGFVS